jgi:hypothetical protein
MMLPGLLRLTKGRRSSRLPLARGNEPARSGLPSPGARIGNVGKWQILLQKSVAGFVER